MPMTFAKSGPNLKHVQTCDAPGCNAEAHFGFDVRLRDAIEAKDGKRAGRWACFTHRADIIQKAQHTGRAA